MNPLALSIDPCFMGVGGMGGSPSIIVISLDLAAAHIIHLSEGIVGHMG